MAISPRLLNEGEHVVVSTRTHPKVLILPLLVLLLVVAAAAWAQVAIDGRLANVPTIVVWVVALVVLVWLVLMPVIRWATTTYTFTNRRFMKRSGLIAKEGRTIPLNRISGVDFEIGVIDRLFGCGTLIVSDASEQGRVELEDVPRVEEVQLRVSEELHNLANPRQHHTDDGT
ncbi:PH domain-containing protein [Nocardioides guangzhouensis]|uniref:PH domain-containing protein n=1 Tax=Nocardioides guangzhouensis TaxID=2497878 RepID=A0A4Q4Z6F8_9ACTN|nr:PH domain-containing protein [Nocardioides guangzhouensis]RYP83397.1 PH domain-containing protein [Nocardioides guangzhouensis]